MQCTYPNCPNKNKSPAKDHIVCSYCPSKVYCSQNCLQLDWELGHKNDCSKNLANRTLNASMAEGGNDFSFSQLSTTTSKKRILEDYEILKPIEMKRHGADKPSKTQLKLVKEKDNSQKQYAMKIMNKKELKSQNNTEGLRKEIKARRKLKHPHIVQLHHFFEDKENTYFILDYAERGTLQSYLENKSKLEESEVFVYFSQTCIGLDYMHKKGLFYPHLQAENILLDGSKNIKINDFKPIIEDLNRLNDSATSLNCYAPELVQNQTSNWKVDIWSLGSLLYHLLHNRKLFQDGNLKDGIKTISSGGIEFGNISNDAKSLLNSLLSFDPNQRPELSDVLNHKWMQYYSAKLKINLNEYIYSGQQRNSMRNVLGQLEPLSPSQNQLLSPSSKFNPFTRPSGGPLNVSPRSKVFENNNDRNSGSAKKLEKPKTGNFNSQNEGDRGASTTLERQSLSKSDNYERLSTNSQRESATSDLVVGGRNSDVVNIMKQYDTDNSEFQLLDKLDNYYTTGQLVTPKGRNMKIQFNPGKSSSINQHAVSPTKVVREEEEEEGNSRTSPQKINSHREQRKSQQLNSVSESNLSPESARGHQTGPSSRNGKEIENQTKQYEDLKKSIENRYAEVYDPPQEEYDVYSQSQDLIKKCKNQLNNIYRNSNGQSSGAEGSEFSSSKKAPKMASDKSYHSGLRDSYDKSNKKELEKQYSHSAQKEKIIENPELATTWLNGRQADKDLDMSFVPRSLRYNLKTIDQSYTELRKKNMQLELMMNGDDDGDIEPERVSRSSYRNRLEGDSRIPKEENLGFFSRIAMAIGCFNRDNQSLTRKKSER